MAEREITTRQTQKEVNHSYSFHAREILMKEKSVFIGLFDGGRSRCSSKCGRGVMAVQQVQCRGQPPQCKMHQTKMVECQSQFPCPYGNISSLFFLIHIYIECHFV